MTGEAALKEAIQLQLERGEARFELVLTGPILLQLLELKTQQLAQEIARRKMLIKVQLYI